jgi:PAS domain S-box-containing protein
MHSFVLPLPDNPIMGYAHHRLILDGNGKACDYEFIEVNQTFEKLTGLKAETLIGSTVRQAMPGIEQSSLDLISTYGQLALEGGQKEFEYYSELLGKWYRVYAYSTEKLTFTTLFIDITASKKNQDKASVTNYKAFFASMQDMVLVAALDGQIIFANDAAIKSLGYSCSELCKLRVPELHPAELQHEGAKLFKALVQEEIFDCHLPLQRQDGSQVLVETRISFGHWDGQDCIFAISKDVSTRIEAENSAREATLRLSLATRAAGVGVWDFDVQQNTLLWNDQMFMLYGINKGDFKGVYEAWRAGLHPDDADRCDLEIAQALAGEQDFDTEFRVCWPDGSIHHIRAIAQVIRSTEGQPLRMIGTNWDITERKKSEEELKAILETANDGFFTADMDARILTVNNAYCTMLGYSREELLTKRIWDIDAIEDTEDVKAHIKLLAEQCHDRFETRQLCKDGRQIYVEISATMLRTPDSRLVVFAHDISGRKQSEIALREAKNQAEKASRAKSEFLANMSHEIRTPLNGVIGFTELLQSTTLTPIQKQYVNNVNVSGHTLLDLINDILDFSKIEAGMMNLEIVKTDIWQLLNDSIAIIQYAADKKSLELLLSIAPAMPRYAMVDPIRLKQVFANLLSNAIKFTEQGRVELCALYESLPDSKGKFIFSVRDTGIGISESQKQKLFKAFTQADSSTTRKFGGTGLGLIISDLLVQQMNSKIHIDTVQGEGSTFYFELVTQIEFEDSSAAVIPITVKPDKQHANKHYVPAAGLSPAGTMLYEGYRILIAEDVAMNTKLIKAMLDKLFPGVDLIDVSNGLDVIDAWQQQHPDLILMDVQMPGLDGLEVTRLIRKLEAFGNSHVPIIALTAGAFQEEKERCLAAGMDNFMTKPVEVESITNIVGAYLQLPGRT